MNIIIFGCAGFIGTNLSKRLLSEGHKVLGVDNFFTGKLYNIGRFLDNDNYRFCNADITNKNLPEMLISDVKSFFSDEVDVIYNLACPASPTKYQVDYLYTIHCSLAVEALANIAIKYGALLVQSSTSEVYGDPDDLHKIQNESYRGNVNCLGPRACYDEGKRLAETLIYAYTTKGLKAVIFRIFNTYGPWMDTEDGRVVSNFICQALRGEDLTVYGDGSQTRTFLYIDDLVDALVNVRPSMQLGPYNVGGIEELSMKDLASKILSRIPRCKSKIIYKELPEDDPHQRHADITFIKEVLGWKPKTSLDDGLYKTMEYFANYFNGKTNEAF